MRNVGWKVIWCCVSMCPFLPSPSHSCVYCPHGSEISLPSFHSRITQHVGGFYVHLGSSPRAKNCSSLSVCCLLASVLPRPYIVIYTYHVLFWLEAREIWGYYWATGKSPFRGHVSNDLLQVLLENSEDITPYYSPKSYCFLWRDIFHWWDHISLPLDVFFFYCFLKRNLVWMRLLRMSLKSSLSCVFACINITFLKCSVCVGTYQTHWPFLQ